MRAIRIIPLLLCCFMCSYDACASSGAQVGSITFIEGVCDITGADGQAVIAAEGQPVYLNDRIRTKSYSKVQIKLLDKSVVKAAPSSCFVIEEFFLGPGGTRESCRVSLTRGKIEAVVSKTGAPDTFCVDTPNATGSVKGSDIFVSYMAGRTAVFVQEGAIAVSAASIEAAPVRVAVGECVVVPFNEGPSDVRRALDMEMKQHKKDVERALIRKWVPGKDAAEMNAVIVTLSGTVRIYKKGASDWRPASENDVVSEAEKVQTGNDGKAQIRLGNGNALYLEADTELGFSRLRYDPETGAYENTFDMSVGEVIGVIEKIDSQSTFQLRTPTAVSGVRGTVLRVVVPAPTIDIPVPETRVFFEGGSGMVTSIMTGKTQQLFAGQHTVVNPQGMISAPAVTSVDQRIGPGLPMPMAKPVDGYMAGKPFAGQGADMKKPFMPEKFEHMPGKGLKEPLPPKIDPAKMLLPPLPPFEQVFMPFDPNVLAKIPFALKPGGVTTSGIYQSDLNLVIKVDGTWTAVMAGGFNSGAPIGPWTLDYTDLKYQSDTIIFSDIPSTLTPAPSTGVITQGSGFVGCITGTETPKTLSLDHFSGDFADNTFKATADGTWEDTHVIVAP